jgi:signal transduction histidine kinase
LATVAEQSLEGLDVNSLLDSTVQSNLELVERFGQLDEQRNRLEHKVKELVEIAQNTVHDLKRPVSVLRLMMSTLQKGYCGELPERAGDAVQNGMLALQQMDLLIRDLLDSSRLDHDGITLDFQQIDPTLLFAQVVNTLRFEVEERDAQVRIEPMTNVCADEWALTKAASNLVGNALQYADPNRRLVIRIWMDEEGDEWRLFVRDNGIGIPEKDRRRLFRRFERGSNTSGISGSGLGLHIVKEILAGHGGHVTFESHLGVGTTFCLHLPKQPFQPEHSPVSDVPEQQLLED